MGEWLCYAAKIPVSNDWFQEDGKHEDGKYEDDRKSRRRGVVSRDETETKRDRRKQQQ